MKRMHPLFIAISASLIFGFAATSSFSEEAKKTDAEKKAEASKGKTYKDRVAGESAYNLDDEDVNSEKKTAEKAPPKYPLATRIEPEQKGTPSLTKKRNLMITSFQKNKFDEAKEIADALKADPAANANDKAMASRVLLLIIVAKDKNNLSEAIPELEEVIASNGLDNNVHYEMMSILAERYFANQDYQDALETADRFLNETKFEKKEVLAIKGNSLYRLKREKDAIAVLGKVHEMDPNDVAVTQMLARAYSDIGQPAKAAELTKQIAQASGGDRVTRVNLAITYRDAKQYVEAADVIADLRRDQQLVEERDYLTAINIYSAMKNKEEDLANVIQEGLDKGALKPSAVYYNKLAEAHYYSGEVDKAIAAWALGAPLSKNGAAYLNLAIVQCQDHVGKWAGCKESAKKAIEKGGINVNDANAQIAKANKGLGQSK